MKKIFISIIFLVISTEAFSNKYDGKCPGGTSSAGFDLTSHHNATTLECPTEDPSGFTGSWSTEQIMSSWGTVAKVLCTFNGVPSEDCLDCPDGEECVDPNPSPDDGGPDDGGPDDGGPDDGGPDDGGPDDGGPDDGGPDDGGPDDGGPDDGGPDDGGPDDGGPDDGGPDDGGSDSGSCSNESQCYSEALSGSKCNLDRDLFSFSYISAGNYNSSCGHCEGHNSSNYNECSSDSDPSGCANYSDCRSEALSNTNCDDNDRDSLNFQFIGQGDYSADCDVCGGPNYLSFSECESGACDFGLNPATGKCWSINCPHGDCIDPTDEESEIEAPPKKDDNTDERISEIITAINSVKDAIKDDDTPQKVDQLRTELSEKITIQTQELVTTETKNTDRVVEALNQVKEKVDSDVPSEDIDYTGLLEAIKENTKSTSCALDPSGEGCTNTTPIDDPDYKAAADSMVSGVIGSGIYSSLSQFQNITISVSSECPRVFRYTLEFMGSYTVDVCAVFDPIVPLLRLLFSGFWGFVGFRIVTNS